MNKYLFTLFLALFSNTTNAAGQDANFKNIKNYLSVSETLASAGSLDLEEYQTLKAAGFKHVINLVPGNQLKERKYVESLGMTYEQIPVSWNHPKQSDFDAFVELMEAYGDDKVFVHCQLNWRASSFVYLFRVTQLGVSAEDAQKDMLEIWEPHDGWQEYIDATVAAGEPDRE